MSKLWFVELSVTAVVVAEDEQAAYMQARNSERDIFRDAPDAGIEVMHVVESMDDLRDEWDTDCVPYGGDRNTRIGDLLLSQTTGGQL